MNCCIDRRIRQLREEQRMSQRELARRLGVEAASVCRWERGVKRPSLARVYQMLELFDVSLDYLYGRTDVRETAEK